MYGGSKWHQVLNLINAFSYIYGYLSSAEETTEAMLWAVISRNEVDINRVNSVFETACFTINVERNRKKFKMAHETMPTMVNSHLMMSEVELRGEMPDDITLLNKKPNYEHTI